MKKLLVFSAFIAIAIGAYAQQQNNSQSCKDPLFIKGFSKIYEAKVDSRSDLFFKILFCVH